MNERIIRKFEAQGKLKRQRAGFTQVEALLLMHGFVPDDGAQHKTVVEITGCILGKGYTDLVDCFETMRRKRNELTYEAGVLLSQSESKSALTSSISLVRSILADVKAKNPQLELRL